MQLISSDRLALLLLAPYLLFFVVRALQYVLLLSMGRQLPFDQEMANRGATVLLGRHLRQIFVWSTEPVLRRLATWRVSPNFLTVLCLVLSLVAGIFVAWGQLALGGAVGLIGSSLDYFDGRVARRTDRVSRAGSFLDSTLDRVCDIAFLCGAAVLFRSQVPLLVACIVALGSSLVISYTRAKVESLGGELRVGLMQRPERVVLFCLGALLDPWLAPWAGGSTATFAMAMWLLALFASVTAVQRTLVGFRCLQDRD